METLWRLIFLNWWFRLQIICLQGEEPHALVAALGHTLVTRQVRRL